MSNENPDMTIVGLRFFNVYGPRELLQSQNIINGNPARSSNS